MKTFLSILLSVCILLTAVSVSSLTFTVYAQETDLAASGEIEGDFQYSVSNGEATLTKYTGSATELEIPSTLGGYPVINIGYGAFRDCTGLTSIVIPDSITSIGIRAFYGCIGLTSIVIPDSVTSIGWDTFWDCTGLTSIVIGSSVTEIGSFAFEGCTGLTSMKVSNGNTVYDSRNDCNAIIETESNTLLYGCMNTVIPNTVTSIGGSAFYGCTGLTSVVIPNSVTSIGSGAFSDCTGLVSIVIPDSVTRIDTSVFYGCTGLESIIIPDSVTSIGSSAFYNCTGLTSVVIPDLVTHIDERAFSGCTGLTSMQVSNGNAVFDSRNDCNAIIETESNTLISGCKNTVIPDSVTSIGASAFWGCMGLTSIVIPNSVTSIAGGAFLDCTGLRNIVIPDSVTTIGYNAFDGCLGLTSMKVVEENPVFDSRNNCNAIIETESNTLLYGCMNTVIPSSVTSIDVAAFRGCTGLTNIVIPDSVTSIGAAAFWGCMGLMSVVVPDSVTSIGDYAFGFYYGSENYYWNFNTVKGFTIYGYKGTAAQRYAEKYHFTFIDLSELPTDPPAIIGDADSDGAVTVVDAAQIQKNLVHFPISSFNEKAANVDGDSAVTILDATYIQKWLASIPVPYPIGQPAA